MTGPVHTSRYSSEDFETASIRSAAPSYVSDAPSYHSTIIYTEAAPPYAPPAPRPVPRPTTSAGSSSQIFAPSSQRSAVGLPPIPPAPQQVLNIHNFRIPTWSTANNSATRQYRRVAERRVNQSWQHQLPRRQGPASQDPPTDQTNEAAANASVVRPLEDPDLVGEQAAAEARRERLAREASDDVLLKEDRQWDWLLAQMEDWEERERNWNQFRRELERRRDKRLRLFRHMGGRLL